MSSLRVLQSGQEKSKCNIAFSGARFFLQLVHLDSLVKNELEWILSTVAKKLIFSAKLRNK